MSARGRAIFDQYVATHLKGPIAAALSVESHAHTLISHCRKEGLAPQEVVEEVGDLVRAIRAVLKKA